MSRAKKIEQLEFERNTIRLQLFQDKVSPRLYMLWKIDLQRKYNEIGRKLVRLRTQ